MIIHTFPYQVRIEGTTDAGGDHHIADLIARELFGARHGICNIDEHDHPLGRCPDASISEDCYHVESKYLNQYTYFTYIDRHRVWHALLENCVGGEFCQIFACDHSHVGCYEVKHLGKIGYDYAESLYCFSCESNAQLFCLAVSSAKIQVSYIGTQIYKSKRQQFLELQTANQP